MTRPELPTVLADANVLFSNDQRNLLVTFSIERLIRLRWTKEIEREWVGSLLRKRTDLSPERLERTIMLMREAVPDFAVLTSADSSLRLGRTDPNDRHVAFAAVACAPCTLVTWNMRDFDRHALREAAVELATPDTLLARLYDEAPALVFGAARRAHSFLSNHRREDAWARYLDQLAERGRPASLLQFAGRLRTHVDQM